MKKTILDNGTIVLNAEGGWIVNADHSICTDYQIWLAANDMESNYREITDAEKLEWEEAHKPTDQPEPPHVEDVQAEEVTDEY